MPTQTGTATDPIDLLDKLRLFAASNGYTVNRWAEEITDRWNLNLTKDGKFYNFQARNDTDSIYLSLSTAYSNVNWGLQTDDSGATVSVYANAIGGPFPSYFFYVDSLAFHCVIEASAGVYRHINFGRLIKYGAYTGDEYICGHVWSTSATDIDVPRDNAHSIGFSDYYSSGTSGRGGVVRADHTGLSPNWAGFGHQSGIGNQAIGNIWGGTNVYLLRDSPNTINEVTPLLPIRVYVNDTSDTFFKIGEVSGMRCCDISNINPEEVILANWKIFPVCAKNGAVDQYNSGTYGIAYDTSV